LSRSKDDDIPKMLVHRFIYNLTCPIHIWFSLLFCCLRCGRTTELTGPHSWSRKQLQHSLKDWRRYTHEQFLLRPSGLCTHSTMHRNAMDQKETSDNCLACQGFVQAGEGGVIMHIKFFLW